MHGDEPSATPALLDLAHDLLAGDSARAPADSRAPDAAAAADAQPRRRRALRAPQRAGGRPQPRRAAALDAGGAAAQGACATRSEPELGFNLHDQNRRTTVGDSGVRATIALLAVAGDAAGTADARPRPRQARVRGAWRATLEPFAPGGIARYDEDWNPRAFGDNLTAWGTPVVLIESGGFPGRRLVRRADAAQLRRAADRAPRARAGRPRGRGRLALRGASRATATTASRTSSSKADASSRRRRAEPYRADLAFDVLDRGRRAGRVPGSRAGRSVADPRGRRRAAAGRGEPPQRRGAGAASPALAASVRGIDARSWLKAGGARRDRPARRGAARWHVARLDRAGGASRRGGSRCSRAGRDRGRGPARPRAGARDPVAAGRAAFAADAGRGARCARAARTRLAARCGRAFASASARSPGYSGAPLLRPDARASLLRPAPREAGASRARPRSRSRAVVLDGRELRRSAVAPWRSGATPAFPELGPNVQRAHGRLASALGRFSMGLTGWRFEGAVPDVPQDGADRRAAHLELGLPGRAAGQARPAYRRRPSSASTRSSAGRSASSCAGWAGSRWTAPAASGFVGEVARAVAAKPSG